MCSTQRDLASQLLFTFSTRTESSFSRLKPCFSARSERKGQSKKSPL